MASRCGEEVKLTNDQYEALQNMFKSAKKQVDLDRNGFISLEELGPALDSIGMKLPGYKVRDLMAELDTNGKDNQLDIREFEKLYARLMDEYDLGTKFKKVVSTRTNVQSHGGTSDASSEGTTHSHRVEEEIAFTDWINRNLIDDSDCAKYLKLEQDGISLYKKQEDGIILCKLINKSVPDTIDERTINKTNLSVYRKHENLTLALNSARSIGCNIVNIGPDDLTRGKPHLVLGLLWQIIRIGLLNDINLAHNPGLVLLLEEDEDLDSLRKLSPEQILLRWVNYHLRNAGVNREVRNFGEDIKDSEAYFYLLKQISPAEKGVSIHRVNEPDVLQRAEYMLQEAKKIDCRDFVGPKDVVTGNQRLNLAFVANLFNNYPALTPPDDSDVEIIEETREEKTYRNWINSMGVNPYVNYLYNDLPAGTIIFQLYDIIKPGCVEWNKVMQKFHKMKINFEKLENCNYAVELGKGNKFSLVGIGGQDILDGNQTLTLALVWQLMRAYTLSILTVLTASGKPIQESMIVEWANSQLQGKSSFSSFQDTKLADGKIIIDLINKLKPGVAHMDLVKSGDDEEERMSNAKYAISLARKVGARVYALPEDIVEVKPKMMMTIFACLMAAFYKKESA